MLKLKLWLRAVLALMLVLAIFDPANAADDDDDDDGDSSSQSWNNKQCTIANEQKPSYLLYLRSFSKGYAVGYKEFNSKNIKKSKWIITPVIFGDKTYYEIKDVYGKGVWGPIGSNVYSSSQSFSRSEKVSTLWTIDPPKPNVAVTIKLERKGYLELPQSGSNKNARLSKESMTKWIIKCK
ncbi:uncharacterized protein LOC132203211 [Neocloeon triangulifer]|uniref:uncharacterized protein LOC132203211 n=1 Tax=Neocloeon triangulifer TaxID=2078957 RepID=UPI00286F61F2|nr:uncharacterized protein LOC132203211 [Neocloeon triangulifer]